MSETDDTDELILIPPDFFVTDDLEEPYLCGPYYNVVDSLISQVNYLENRINLIENKSEYSVQSNSINYPVNTVSKVELMSGIRKYNSSDDINKVTRDGFESTQSTPQKPQTRFKLSSCSSSNTERYSPQKKSLFLPSRSNQDIGKVRNDKNNESAKEILQEIDQYICNIQTSSKDTTEKSFVQSKPSISSKNSLNLKDLDYLLRKVDLQTKEFERQGSSSKYSAKQNENYVPNFECNRHKKQMGVSNRNPNQIASEQIPLTSDTSTYNDSFNEKTDSVSSSSEPTQMTALPNVNRLPAGSDFNCDSVMTNENSSHGQRQIYTNCVAKSPSKRENQNARRNIFQDRVNGKHDHRLLSLSHLWNRGDDMEEYMTREEKILQKLEEEKLRRQHCEQLIQHLQCKTLELQEKLAVAVQVDEAKDDAILRFHNSWEQVAERLQSLTKDRNELETEVQNMQAQNAENMLEATKKISHFENESSKALTLAQSSQDKVKELENHISQLTSEIHSLNIKIIDFESISKSETEKNKDLLEHIEQKELELSETTNSLVVIKNEIASSKRAVELCQIELTGMKTQNSHLEMIITEKDEIIKSMERHNQKLLSEIDTHKKIEKDLQQELNKSKEINEKNKLDLRNFYQDQVEIVVRDKLKEFQAQLDKAESSLQEELKKRELTIAKSAAAHIQQISDKHSLEVKLLEEKHSEEVRLYQVKLSQAQQYIENLQTKLNLQYQRKSDMAKQLHKVMEAQWLEALKVINNGRSPVVSNDQDATINQLNVLKTKSHSNLEEVLSMDVPNEQRDKENKIRDGSIIPPLNLGASSSSVYEDNYEGCPYSLNMETPLTSRPKTKQQIETELQKYVQLLLNKQPGNPLDEVNKRQRENTMSEIPTWQPINQEERHQLKTKEKKMKRPWK